RRGAGPEPEATLSFGQKNPRVGVGPPGGRKEEIEVLVSSTNGYCNRLAKRLCLANPLILEVTSSQAELHDSDCHPGKGRTSFFAYAGFSELGAEGHDQQLGQALPDRAAAPLLEGVPARARQVLLEDLLQPAPDVPVVHGQVDLVVQPEGAVVEVRRADRGEKAVPYHLLGWEHRRLIFGDLHAAREQLAEARAAARLRRRNVVDLPWDEDVDVHAPPGRLNQERRGVAVREEIGIRKPEAFRR